MTSGCEPLIARIVEIVNDKIVSRMVVIRMDIDLDELLKDAKKSEFNKLGDEGHLDIADRVFNIEIRLVNIKNKMVIGHNFEFIRYHEGGFYDKHIDESRYTN